MATEIEMLSSESSIKSDKMEDPSADSGNLSRRIVAIAAGEAHTLALSGDGCVYSWGRGMFGRLGMGGEEDELFPVRAKFDSPGKLEGDKLKFVGVAAGAYHSLALADDGSVWSWGYNLYGQLGFDGENSATPRVLERFLELGSPDSSKEESETKSKTPLKVSSVKAGGMMSLAIDDLGTLWLWGNCPQQSSSNEAAFSLVRSFTPTPVWDFYGHTVVKVACGNEHVIALVTVGETYRDEDLLCYSWGNNSRGQLGLGDTESRSKPQKLETFTQDSSWAVYEVSCGAFHTALLTHRKKPSDVLESLCWTFGQGENGQLGHGTTQSLLSPEPVKKLPPSVYLVSVDCGLFHTSVVSSAGDVWSWGMEKGLGLCPDASFTGTDAGDAVYPLHVSREARFVDPVGIACGAAHTVLVAHDGYKIWSWGRGRSGVLGNGRTNDFYAPTVVLWPPLSDDFKQEELNDEKKPKPKDPALVLETGEDMRLMQVKFQTMERYASILHGSIFGKPFEEERDIPVSLRDTGSFDLGREWEKMLESADRGKLARLEMFYRNMLAGVKDKLLKKRIQELIRESLPSSST